MTTLEIVQLPVLNDNYVYLLRDVATGTVGVVDPAVADPVIAELDRRGWRPSLILNTHHHGDHIGGDAALAGRYGARIVAARADAHRIPDIAVAVGDGDRVALGDSAAQVFAVPGHTSGHIAYWFAGAQALFCGDTLFALGCGRMFEGTAEQMWASLERLRRLPDATAVYCAHEYTQSNARFALAVDPTNQTLQARAAEIDAARAKGLPTVPSPLGLEKATNPFLRADDPGFAAALGLGGATPAAVFGETRRRKDVF